MCSLQWVLPPSCRWAATPPREQQRAQAPPVNYRVTPIARGLPDCARAISQEVELLDPAADGRHRARFPAGSAWHWPSLDDPRLMPYANRQRSLAHDARAGASASPTGRSPVEVRDTPEHVHAATVRLPEGPRARSRRRARRAKPNRRNCWLPRKRRNESGAKPQRLQMIRGSRRRPFLRSHALAARVDSPAVSLRSKGGADLLRPGTCAPTPASLLASALGPGDR